MDLNILKNKNTYKGTVVKVHDDFTIVLPDGYKYSVDLDELGWNEARPRIFAAYKDRKNCFFDGSDIFDTRENLTISGYQTQYCYGDLSDMVSIIYPLFLFGEDSYEDVVIEGFENDFRIFRQIEDITETGNSVRYHFIIVTGYYTYSCQFFTYSTIGVSANTEKKLFTLLSSIRCVNEYENGSSNIDDYLSNQPGVYIDLDKKYSQLGYITKVKGYDDGADNLSSYMQGVVDQMNANLNDDGVTVSFEPNDKPANDFFGNVLDYIDEDEVDAFTENLDNVSNEEYEEFWTKNIAKAMSKSIFGTDITNCDNEDYFLDNLPMTFSIEGTGYEDRAARFEYLSVGDDLIIKGLTDCPYFSDGLAVEVFNTSNETLGYLSIPNYSTMMSIIENIDKLKATVSSITPLSKRRSNAKYALMDVSLDLVENNNQKIIDEISDGFDNIHSQLNDMLNILEEAQKNFQDEEDEQLDVLNEDEYELELKNGAMIDKYAYSDCNELVNVIIPDGVIEIGKGAFYGCKNLKSIKIPDSVIEIGDGAFWGCENLTEIIIPNKVSRIYDLTFSDCENLKNVILSDNLTAIGSRAFQGCENLTKITIPNKVTVIQKWAFGGCKRLNHITILNSAIKIENIAFAGCQNIKSISAPNGIENINYTAFHSSLWDMLSEVNGTTKYTEDQNDIEQNNDIKNNTQSIENSGGCYVATCVYGSYDCPEVWTLRRFRDYTLAKTWYGRAFIRTYYAIAPTMVKLFGKTKWFNNFWKPLLDKKVNQLNDDGVENTLYQDVEW